MAGGRERELGVGSWEWELGVGVGSWELGVGRTHPPAGRVGCRKRPGRAGDLELAHGGAIVAQLSKLVA